MDKLLEQMFIKRYCLPFDTNISLYTEGTCTNISSCVCGHYNHISCILQKDQVLSFGVNLMGNGKIPGIHAECAAISKLMPIRNKKRLKSINLVVIRISPKNKIQSSKPCNNCIKTMRVLPKKLGYIIKHIYYSTSDGTIIKTTLSSLEIDEKHYSRYIGLKYSNVF